MPWCSGYHYCTLSFYKAWNRVLRRFKSCSRHVGDSRLWGCLTMVLAGNKARRLSSVNHATKTIHQFNSTTTSVSMYYYHLMFFVLFLSYIQKTYLVFVVFFIIYLTATVIFFKSRMIYFISIKTPQTSWCHGIIAILF